MQSHCQTCHRPGEIGPMSFLTYQQVRPWSAAIREAVATKKMPPWYADPLAKHSYKNDFSLSKTETDTLLNWIANGSAEGDAQDAPPPRKFVENWNIGQPDKVVQMPEPYQIPASGTIEYTYVIIPSGFTKDTWVKAAEIRPGNRAAMHHAILFTRTPGSKWLSDYPTGKFFVPAPRPGTTKRSSTGDRTVEGSLADEWIVSYSPGVRPVALPENTAFLVKAGSDFVLQLHYTTNGKASSDLTKVGLALSNEPPTQRAFIGGVTDNSFAIPPGAADYKANGSLTLGSEVKLLAVGPHMHLRGKSMSLKAEYSTGESDALFNVPRYDFHWQQFYEFDTPLTLSKGSKLEMVAAFDNSRNNKYNPDPDATVKWGDQSWEEMALALCVFQIDPNADLDTLFAKPKKPEAPVAATQ